MRAFNRITLTSLKECESQLLQDIGDLCTLRLNEIASVGKETGVRLAAENKVINLDISKHLFII